MKALFSDQIVNKGRQLELDVARGLAVLFMILIHFQQFFLPVDFMETGWALTVDFLGGVPAAPVFMVIMGIGFVYTRNGSPQVFFRRGMMLILSGYLLNLMRGFLPALILWQRTGYENYLFNGVKQLLYIDILQFAGLAMITFGCFRYWKLSNRSIAAVGVVLALLNFQVMGIKPENLLLEGLTGLFWGSGELSFFPYLSWIFYPIVGYLFGSLLSRCTDKRFFYTIMGLGSSAVWFFSIFVLQGTYGLDIGLFSEYGYYHHTLLGNIAFTGFVLGWVSLLFFLTPLIPAVAQKTIDRWSKNVTDIYYAQWVIIGWLAIPLGYAALKPPQYFGILLLVLISSDGLAYGYGCWKCRQKAVSNPPGDQTGETMRGGSLGQSSERSDPEVYKSSKEGRWIYILIATLLVGVVVSVWVMGEFQILSTPEGKVLVHRVYNLPFEEVPGDGTRYSGPVDVFSGRAYGKGEVSYADGSRYEGEILADQWQGQGVWRSVSGETYQGSFQDGEYHGYGVWQGSNGDSYTGEFIDGEFNGEGTYVNADGTPENGVWHNGDLQ